MKVTVTYEIEPEEVIEVYKQLTEANNQILTNNIIDFFSTAFQSTIKANQSVFFINNKTDNEETKAK